MKNSNFSDQVACLNENLNYSEAAVEFVTTAEKLPDTAFLTPLRVAIAYGLFHGAERLIESDDEPTKPFAKLLGQYSDLMKASIIDTKKYTTALDKSWDSVEDETGSHYGNLFGDFDEVSYYEEAYRVLHDRFSRNTIEVKDIGKKTALDAGCGGGRYTVALKKLGFDQATGLDWSKEGLQTARERLAKSGIDGVNFEHGTVLDLPFENESFDFVYSNGVLHHTTDMKKGLSELFRVLKPNGQGFLQLMESPGGIHWDVIEILRPLLKPVPYDIAREQFRLMGVPANRRYYILDHIMVPINIRPSKEEVELWLKENGATNIRRLTRGTDYDRIEKHFHNRPYAHDKVGVGENRYVFEKG